MSVLDDEVIGVMIDGGIKVCDYALEQWINDKYQLGDDMRQEYIQRWNEIKRRVREIGRLLKQELKNAN